MIINKLYSVITNRFEIKAYDIELIGVILRGILKDPDFVSDVDFEKVIDMVELVA
jgi:hypothetical protein